MRKVDLPDPQPEKVLINHFATLPNGQVLFVSGWTEVALFKNTDESADGLIFAGTAEKLAQTVRKAIVDKKL